jgi:hypothetical protein
VKPLCVEQSLNSSTIITSNGPTRAKAISCPSVPQFRHHHYTLVAHQVPSNVTSASAACSSSSTRRMNILILRDIQTGWLGLFGAALVAVLVAGGVAL